MKWETLFLKVTVFLIGIPILALCIFGLRLIAKGPADHYVAYLVYTVLIVMYLTAIPFYFALYQTFKLLSYIDKDMAFSELSINALKNIKYCAAIIGIIYGACLPLFYLIGDKEDAPGIIVIGLSLTFAPIVIAVFTALLQKLLKNAIDIKAENERNRTCGDSWNNNG